jgi:hypothetical protein
VKRLAAAVVAGLAWAASGGSVALAQDPVETMTLVLPHAPGTDDTVWIEVQVGAIGRGQEISVTTATGEPLGVISPFGVRAAQDAGTYLLPVPSEAIKDGRLSVKLAISQFGKSRAPTSQEVRGVELKLAPH